MMASSLFVTIILVIWTFRKCEAATANYASQETYHGCPGGDCVTGSGRLDIPETAFSCRDVRQPGYYADVETACQVFHICEPNGRKHSLLCPKGTIFNQALLVCDWWHSADCSISLDFYDRSNEYVFGFRTPPKVPSAHYDNRRSDNVTTKDGLTPAHF